MWENTLKLNGVIEKKDGSKFNENEVFKLLEDNGFEYIGGYQNYNRKEMLGAIEYIVSQINKNELDKMLIKHNEFYGEETDIVMLKETLLMNSGTGVYYDLFKFSLDKEVFVYFEKWSNSNWNISDDFEVTLAEHLVEKIDSMFL